MVANLAGSWEELMAAWMADKKAVEKVVEKAAQMVRHWVGLMADSWVAVMASQKGNAMAA